MDGTNFKDERAPFWLTLVLAVALDSHWVWGGTFTLNRSGIAARWQQGHPQFVANPGNQSGLGDQEVFSAFTRALSRWRGASRGTVSFDYWQGRDSAIYRAASALDSVSRIFFASQMDGLGDRHMDSNVLGLTQLWYRQDSGEILEADVVLNDLHYQFTTTVSDSTTLLGSDGLGSKKVYLENVVTHELGHALGLAHGGAMQSTMFFTESPDQAFLGCDDQVAIQRLYDSSVSELRGELRLQVLGVRGEPLIGAQVQAISRARGILLSAALSDREGWVHLSALEPGIYDLLVEPFYAGAGALPDYYSGLDFQRCDGKPFARGVVGGAGVNLPGFEVKAGQSITLGPYSVECPHEEEPPIRAATENEIVTPHFGWFERWRGNEGSSKVFKIHSDGSSLSVRVISFSAYSPVRLIPRLLDDAGREVRGQSVSPVYRSDSGFVNYDSRWSSSSLRPGEYRLLLQPVTVRASAFPAGALALERDHFFVIEGGMADSLLPLTSDFTDHPKCRQAEDFAPYSSPSGPPPRSAEGAPQVGAGGCSAVRGASAQTLFGNLLGAALVLLGWVVARESCRRRPISLR